MAPDRPVAYTIAALTPIDMSEILPLPEAIEVGEQNYDDRARLDACA
jgi:hypothetical protein